MIGWEHTFVHEITHLLDAIVNDKPVAPYGATFEDGYKNAVVCDAILKSAETGREDTRSYIDNRHKNRCNWTLMRLRTSHTLISLIKVLVSVHQRKSASYY